MLNVLLLVLLAIAFFVAVIVLYVFYLIRRTYRRVRHTFNGSSGSSQSAGRQADDARGHRGGSRQAQGGATVYDTRPDEVAGRKIFSKDEGEYIDYTDV